MSTKLHPLTRKFAFVVTTLVISAVNTFAQTTPPASAPDLNALPVPEIKTDLGTMPGVKDLPVRPNLPDALVMNDGTRVTTPEQWQQRREEIKRTLEYYCTGEMPPPPGNVKGIELTNELVLDGQVKYRLVRLTFGPEEKLSLDIGIFTPATGGPFPAIIYELPGTAGSPPDARILPRLPQGHGPTTNAVSKTAEETARQYRVVSQRGYALVMFNPNDCAEDTNLRNADGSWAFRHTRFLPAYPGYDWGVVAVWAWADSRVADYLETDPAIDHSLKFIATGASRNGKGSLYAAAFDDRLMGAPVVTGGGGVGAYRFTGPRGSETIDKMADKHANWFAPHLHEFVGHRDQLPFDEHWFLALAAPRPFIALEGDADIISLPDAVKHSILAAREVYALLGAPDNLGIHYSHHAHAFTDEDWIALMDFFDKYSRGMKVDKTFDHFLTDAETDAARAKR